MRTNLHPLRNLPVGSDPSVLTSNGMSVSGSAVVSLATRENLFYDPSFESDGIAGYIGNNANVTVTKSSDRATDGDYSLSCSTSDSLPADRYVARTVSSPSNYAGRTLTLSVDVWRPAGSETAGADGGRVIAIADNTEDGAQATFLNGWSSLPEDEWTRVHVTRTLRQGINSLSIRLYAPADGAVAYYDRIQFELAGGPREWVNGTEIVPAYNPLTGEFDDNLQAVRVYCPASAGGATDGHRLNLSSFGAERTGYALTHVWTDDPGSVGKQVRLRLQQGTTGESISINLALAETPKVIAGSLPMPNPEISALDVRVCRANSGVGECNLLYSASQVSPHPIERYNDERSRGHELVDPDAYWKGSRSLEAPIEYDASARLYIPETRLRLNNGIN
jgi:hypothetical protein